MRSRSRSWLRFARKVTSSGRSWQPGLFRQDRNRSPGASVGGAGQHRPPRVSQFLSSSAAASPPLVPRGAPTASAPAPTTPPAARATTALFLRCWRASTLGIFIHDLKVRVREINGACRPEFIPGCNMQSLCKTRTRERYACQAYRRNSSGSLAARLVLKVDIGERVAVGVAR